MTSTGETFAANKLASNNIVLSRLAIERCNTYLAQLHAIMFLCHPKDLGFSASTAHTVRKLMAQIESELSDSAVALEREEGPDGMACYDS